jgi:hypothetical protein
MATTDQRSGFRLPWASEARPGAPAQAQTPPIPDSTPVAEGETIADPTTAEATEMQETTIPDPQATSWPETDASTDTPVFEPQSIAEATPRSTPTAADVAAPSRPRRENLLVTGLVRAMRDAATAARQETAARFADEAKSRVEAIQSEAAGEATELRKLADSEVVEIRDWSKTEMARIREETDKRIAERKQYLDSEIDRHTARVEHRIARVEAAVGDFERQMEAFFVKLFAEEDPAHLAGLAEQLPEAPSLDLDELDRPDPDSPDSPDPDFPMAVLDARGAEAAEAEASADLESGDDDDMTVSLPEDEEDAIPDDDVARRLDAFTIRPKATTDALTSQLAVVGLVSVASIAGFKRALARTSGVRSVTVASGPSGDFVFTVNHDPETDLRSTVPSLDGFGAVVTGDADGVLTITATDPESAH